MSERPDELPDRPDDMDPPVIHRGGPVLDPATEDEFRAERADYDEEHP